MKSPPHPERAGIAFALVSIVLFAANVLLLRAISLRAPEVDGYVASVYRGGIGFLFVVLAYWGRGFQPSHLLNRPLMMFRGAAGAISILLFYVTIPHLGAGRSVIVNLTYPIFGALLAIVWLRERLAGAQFLWMAASLGGLVVLLSSDSLHAGFSRFEVVGLLGAVVAGAAVVLIRLLGKTEHPSTIYASQCLWTAVVALPFCASHATRLPWTVVAGLVVASLFVTGGQLALTHSFRTLSVARGSSIQMLLPIATAVGGMLCFGERYALVEALGAGLTLVATWQAARRRA